MWLPSLGGIRDTAGAFNKIKEAGGPRRVRLARVGRPHGHFLPTSELTIEVETANGEVVRMTPEVPVPFFYAWGYRLARALGVPIASSLDPEDVSLEVPVPGWAWPGGS